MTNIRSRRALSLLMLFFLAFEVDAKVGTRIDAYCYAIQKDSERNRLYVYFNDTRRALWIGAGTKDRDSALGIALATCGKRKKLLVHFDEQTNQIRSLSEFANSR